MWHPESHWHVTPTRNWDQAYARGGQYAIAAVSATRADGCNVLSRIFRDMIKSSVERENTARKEKQRRPRGDAVMAGFLHQLEKMFEPKEHGELGADLDAAIELAQRIDREARRLKCSDKQTMKNVLGWQTMHIKQLQKIRARIARSSD
jgi:hypothetical protein